MKVKLGGFVFSLIVTVGSINGIAKAEQSFCVKKFNNTKEKSVFLAGGNAYDLFSSYVNELKSKGQDVKIGDVKIYFYDGQKVKEVSLSWRDWLSGKSQDEILKSKLSKYDAIINENELAKAYQSGKDIYCINPNPVVNTKEKNKPVCSEESKSHINLGLQFVNNKDIDNAIKEFTAATKASNCPLAYGNLIQAYIVKQNYNFAVDTYKEGVSKAGNDPFLHFSGAVAYTAKKDFDYALDALDKALKSGQLDKKLLESKELNPLFENRKQEFCNLMDKYKIVLKKCL